jgi:hypothetical protein
MTAKSGQKRIVENVFILPDVTKHFVWNGRFAPIAGEKEYYIGGSRFKRWNGKENPKW